MKVAKLSGSTAGLRAAPVRAARSESAPRVGALPSARRDRDALVCASANPERRAIGSADGPT